MALKTRIIPTLLCRGRELVKGSGFVNERVVGNAISACRIHNMRGVDELCLLEIGGDMIAPDVVELLASECFMPLAVGGGVNTLEQFGLLIKNGADKVVLSRQTDLIKPAAEKFGSQAVVLAINVPAGDFTDLAVWTAKFAEGLGAGEVLLQSRERDGTLSGYDLGLIAAVSRAVSIPVIASGGCGTYEHMAEALRAGAHAVAAGAMFQFTDRTPQGAAKFLRDCGFNTRVEAA